MTNQVKAVLQTECAGRDIFQDLMTKKTIRCRRCGEYKAHLEQLLEYP